jgi:hypothetical protein
VSSARVFRALGGWCWRLLVGGLLCTSYPGSIVATGWTYRWMQALVLRGWWRQSRFRGIGFQSCQPESRQDWNPIPRGARHGSFEEFCAALGPDAPVPHPRWFAEDRPAAGTVARGIRVLALPVAALWRNFRTGVTALACTYAVTAPGCLLLVAAWELGWLNAFQPGRSPAPPVALVALAGSLLFCAAMCYVPMAQAHQAATGDWRAFFDHRFVGRLIEARLPAYVGLTALLVLASLGLEALRTWTPGMANGSALEDAGDLEAASALRRYLLVCCLLALFPALVVVRGAAAVVYRSAVLEALRRGLVTRGDLHPTLAGWLDRLDLPIAAAARPERPRRRGGRAGLYGLLFGLWLVLVAGVHAAELLNYHPIVGLMNRVLVQFPCFDCTPRVLP